VHFLDKLSQEIDEMLAASIEETRVYREAQEKVCRSIAINLLRQHLDLAMIAEATGLSIAQLQDLRSQA
jgi:predicted transposase YdaD